MIDPMKRQGPTNRSSERVVVATAVLALLAGASCADDPEPIIFDPVITNSGTEAISRPDESVPAVGVCSLLGDRLESLAIDGYTDPALSDVGGLAAVAIDSDDPAVAAAAADLQEAIVEVLTARQDDPGASPDAIDIAVPALIEACGQLGVEITTA